MMRVGILSDTHDNQERTERALELLSERDPQLLLHAGDLASGRSVPLFSGWQVWLAQGNVDAVSHIQDAIEQLGAPIHYGAMHELDLDGARIGIIHGDDEDRLEGMINSGAFDLIVHGHSHTFRDDRIGSTRVVNPGAVHRASTPSVCVYDTREDSLERIEL